MNATQTQRIEWLRRFMTEGLKSKGNPALAEKLEKFEVEETAHGAVWVSVDTASGVFGSVLHAVTAEHWFINVGPRGALRAYSYPKSCEQFRGRSWCGIQIMRGGK